MAWAIVAAALLILVKVVIDVPVLGAGNVVIDFDAFYIVSQMFHEGRLADAYDVAVMTARQSELAGRNIFMPWSYPPQFDLIIAPLALMPRGIAYGLFTALSLLAWLLVLRRLAGPWLPGVLVAILPALAMVVLVGQSGLLIAALIGWFCLAWLRRPQGGRGAGLGAGLAGIPLGLLVIKPHLAIGIGFLTLVAGRWRVLAVALGVVALSSALATLLLGAEIWAVFLAGAGAASENMEKGLYPLFRMTSAYALLFTLGVPPGLALVLHFLLAAVALGLVVVALALHWPPARLLGVAVFATLAFSPYNYDYDMPIMGIGLALLAPDLLRWGRGYERLALCLSTWLCTGTGMVTARFLRETGPYDPLRWPALGGAGYLLAFALIWYILMRAHRAERGQA